MKLIIDIPDSFYSDLKENRIDLGAIGCQLLLDKVKNGTPLEEQKPCEDAISRQAAAEVLLKYAHSAEGKAFAEFLISQINNLPPVTPQYTDAEIQKMQDLEFAEIQKAYELGKAEGVEVLEEIRAEIKQAADKQFQIAIGVADLNERYTHIQMENAYRHSLNIIDKYKASPTGAEGSEE